MASLCRQFVDFSPIEMICGLKFRYRRGIRFAQWRRERGRRNSTSFFSVDRYTTARDAADLLMETETNHPKWKEGKMRDGITHLRQDGLRLLPSFYGKICGPALDA